MVKLNLIVLEKWSESWIYAINTYSSTLDGSTPPPLWKLFSSHWNVHGYHARKTIQSIYVTVRGQLPCIFVELPKYCLYDMKHQSINQSFICPPNVDSTMWYPIHIEMQCIAVCHVERHQKYYNTYLSQCRWTCSNAYEQYTWCHRTNHNGGWG